MTCIWITRRWDRRRTWRRAWSSWRPQTPLLTAATVRLVEGLMRVKAWGPVPIKGLAEPVEVWELLGVSGRSRACRAPEPVASPILWGGRRR